MRNSCPTRNRSRGKREDKRGYEHVLKNIEGFPDNLTVADIILLCAKSEHLRQEAGPKQLLTLSPETLNYKEIFLLIIMVKCKSNTCFIK